MDTAYVIDTLFTLFSITLIILMVPGFAMLEAGLVRTKNVSSVLDGQCHDLRGGVYGIYFGWICACFW